MTDTPTPPSEGQGADPKGVAHEAIMRALNAVPDIDVWQDPFEIAADVALTALRSLPVHDRMRAMGMRETCIEVATHDECPLWTEAPEPDLGETK